MPKLYADAAYYGALLIRQDRLHEPAVALSARLGAATTITSDPILVEVLAYVSKRGQHARASGLAFVDALRADPSVTIIRQTPDLFDAGLDLYRRRLDKGYSLTDCMSMIVCRQLDLTRVLTHDHHFEQEGFEILLKAGSEPELQHVRLHVDGGLRRTRHHRCAERRPRLRAGRADAPPLIRPRRFRPPGDCTTLSRYRAATGGAACR